MPSVLTRILKACTPKPRRDSLSTITSSSSSIHLPVEIYRLVFAFLPTVYPLLQVSHFFRDEAERMLYQTIDLSGDNIQHAKRRMHLFVHLAQCERVAMLVRVMLIPPLAGSPHAKRPRTQENYFIALNKALRATGGLKRLTVSSFSTHIATSDLFEHPSVLLAGCKFQLEYLSVQGLYVRDCPEQRELQELDVKWGFVNGKVFPRLSTLAVYKRWDQDIVFGEESNVRAVYWMSARPLKAPPTPSRVTALRVALFHRADPTQLFRPFPLLRFLRIDFGFTNDDESIRQLLASLSDVKYIEKLHLVHHGGLVWRPTREIAVSTVFDLVPSLQTFALTYSDSRPVEWHRGSSDAVFATNSDVEWKSSRWRDLQ